MRVGYICCKFRDLILISKSSNGRENYEEVCNVLISVVYIFDEEE